MMLIEETLVPDAVFPLTAFKAHLRLGAGFAEDAEQDAVLTSFLRAAVAAIEARIGKALVARSFSWSITRWREDAASETLPLAPVQSIDGVTIVDRLGTQTDVQPERYALDADGQRPKVISIAGSFPALQPGGKAVIHFTAGYGPAWSDIPSDLSQAAFLLAAHYYEYRDETSLARGCMPFGVQSLLERYRPVRLFGAGGA